MEKQTVTRRRWPRYVGGTFGALALMVVPFLFPWNTHIPVPQAHPAATYEEAARRIEALQGTVPPDSMNPVCNTQFLTHGQKTARALVLVHGYTNCPQQFLELGRRLHALGYNVLIAPLPHHGLADRMTEDHARLKAEELVTYANEMTDIAQGLGEKTAMMGLSAGGITTAWAAQHRTDLDIAMIMAPAFGFKALPPSLTAPMMNATGLMSNSYDWWDKNKRAEGGTTHAYPRYSKHALAQILRLGFSIRAETAKPATPVIVMVTNANDAAVSNETAAEVANEWRAKGTDVTSFEFDAALGINHDMIDPAHREAKIELVYPRLMELLAQAFEKNK